MMALQEALRLKPEGFFFCPAFLPPKTNLTARAQDFRGYASFDAFRYRRRRNIGYSPQPLQLPFFSEGLESVSPLSCSLPVCLWV